MPIAYSLNFTAVPHGRPLGYLTVWPAGDSQPPLYSTLNSYDGRTKANAAIVPAGDYGAINVYATDDTDLVIDISGYFKSVSDQFAAASFLRADAVHASLDTRDKTKPAGLGPPYLAAKVQRAFPVLVAKDCKIPNTAQAYSLNFTAVPHGFLGYVTVWPTGRGRPFVSTLNAYTGTVTANAAIVPTGNSREISVYATNDTDMVIDIDGYFAPSGPGGLSLYSVTPCRVLDTRLDHGRFNRKLSPPVDVVNSPCGVPSIAQAYVLNATVVPYRQLGYLTFWPDGGNEPLVSTLDALDGAVTSNMAVVPAGNQGKVDADAKGLTDLILDISSYFASPPQ